MSRISNLLFERKTQILIASFSLLLFVLIALDVHYEGLFVKIDNTLVAYISTLRTSLLDKIFGTITTLGNSSSIYIIAAFISVILLLRKRRVVELLFVWVSVYFSFALFSLLKLIFERPRPTTNIGHYMQMDYSFPSGHAAISTTVGLILFYLFYPSTKGSTRVITLTTALFFPLLVSLSRLYLGVHYLSDIAGGVMLGVFGTVLWHLILMKRL